MELVGEDLAGLLKKILRAYWSLYEGTRYNEQQWQKAVEETPGSLTQPRKYLGGRYNCADCAFRKEGTWDADYQHWFMPSLPALGST